MGSYKSDGGAGGIASVRSAIEAGPAWEVEGNELILRVDPDPCNGLRFGPNGGLMGDKQFSAPAPVELVASVPDLGLITTNSINTASVTASITNPVTNCQDMSVYGIYGWRSFRYTALTNAGDFRPRIDVDVNGGGFAGIAHENWRSQGDNSAPPASTWTQPIGTNGFILNRPSHAIKIDGTYAPGATHTATLRLAVAVTQAGAPRITIADTIELYMLLIGVPTGEVTRP